MENKTPELSVIIPCYNCLELTKRCIESIRCSEDFNLIIVDNGSTDGTEEYIKNLAKEKNIPFEEIDGSSVRLTLEEKIKAERPTTVEEEIPKATN